MTLTAGWRGTASSPRSRLSRKLRGCRRFPSAISTIRDLAAFRHLKQTNATRWSRTFVAEGSKLIERMLASPYPLESLLAGQESLALLAAQLPPETPIFVVPEKLVEQIVGFNFHRGLVAIGKREPEWSLQDICQPRSDGLTPELTIVVCVDVHDPENLGSILRSRAAFGVSGVVLAGRCADPLSRRVLRVSMGAALAMPLVMAGDVAGVVSQLRARHGVSSWATVLDPAAPRLTDLPRPPRLALLLGNEAHGLSAACREICAAAVTIEMRGNTDSLNVAVAAGIFLFQACIGEPRGTAQNPAGQ